MKQQSFDSVQSGQLPISGLHDGVLLEIARPRDGQMHLKVRCVSEEILIIRLVTGGNIWVLGAGVIMPTIIQAAFLFHQELARKELEDFSISCNSSVTEYLGNVNWVLSVTGVYGHGITVCGDIPIAEISATICNETGPGSPV